MQEEISYSRGQSGISYTLVMDEIRKSILEFSKRPGQSLAKMSRDIGRNPTYLQQFITKGSPIKLGEIERAKLSLLMGVDEIALGRPVIDQRRRAQQNARISGPITFGPAIPAYGHAVGGSDGQFILNGNKIADILAPPALAGVPGAYAVYVVGESMEPRYHSGEAVFVNPRLPVRRGDYVVAQIAGADDEQPEAYVKRFINRDTKVIRFQQFNPKKVLSFPAKMVISVHRIIMAGDG